MRRQYRSGDEAGGADADAQGKLRRAGQQPVDELLQPGERVVAIATDERQALPVADFPREVDDGAADLPLSHVDTDELTGITRDLQQDGRLAAARGPSTDLLDQARSGELVDHVRDGRPGQVRPARDVRPADRPQTRPGRA